MSSLLTNSFLLGYVPKNDSPSQRKEAWVHINLWEEKEKKQDDKIIIDFGIMANIHKIKSINIYSPYLIESVTDIAPLLKEHRKLIYAVFTGSNISDNPDGYVINPHKDEPFVLQDSNPSLKRNERDKKSNLIQINVSAIKEGTTKRHYFRIRVTFLKKNCKGLVFTHNYKNQRLSDFFTSTEIIDFRLNSMRINSDECKTLICKNDQQGEFFDIRSINYLILRAPSEIIIYHGKEMKSSRYLEPEIWKEYKLHDDMIAYHFYKKAAKTEKDNNGKNIPAYEYIDSFSVLARFQHQKPKNLKIFIFSIGVALAVGCLSGFLANLFFRFWSGNV